MTMESTATVAWFPDAKAESLPPMMLETDPRLSCQHLEDHLESIIANGSQCPIYRYSNILAYKPVCRKRETKLMTIAGGLTVPVISKVGIVDDISSQWYQKGALLELGRPLDVTKILPAERVSIARHMIVLVAGLHHRGILHGDIKPENFVMGPDDDALRIMEFSSARMMDDSDLNTWPADIPTVEYTSPKRSHNGEPTTLLDDNFALAVSIWAVFAGERPLNGLFNTNEGHTPNLRKITDDELLRSVVDVLTEGGLKLDDAHALPRRNSFNSDGIDRTVSFPLSLFGADPDDLDEPDGVKEKPHFCPHCFELAMLGATTPRQGIPKHPVDYPEFCHLRNAGRNAESVSEYTFQWLKGQETASEETGPADSVLEPNTGDDRSRPRSPAQRMSLRVDTNVHQEVEKGQGSGLSAATIKATDQTYRRSRAVTAVRHPLPTAPSVSDEGYESIGQRTSNAASDPVKPQPPNHNFQRTMSAWSESSVGSCTDDDDSDGETNAGGQGSSRSDASTPPLTPLPLNLKRLQVTSSFESVTLSDQDIDDGGGTVDAVGHW